MKRVARKGMLKAEGEHVQRPSGMRKHQYIFKMHRSARTDGAGEKDRAESLM